MRLLRFGSSTTAAAETRPSPSARRPAAVAAQRLFHGGGGMLHKIVNQYLKKAAAKALEHINPCSGPWYLALSSATLRWDAKPGPKRQLEENDGLD